MQATFFPFLLVFTLASWSSLVAAGDSKELRELRRDAQKERQQQVRERNKEVNGATRAFRAYTRDLKADYRERAKKLDTEFELREVERKAEHDARVASAEAEYQKKLSALFMKSGVKFTEETLRQMQSEAKAFSNALFELKKQSAKEMHAVRIANEQEKNALWTEMDRMALDKAESLGLTQAYPPILATPIGDGLTSQEERWNEREKKNIARIIERNRKALNEFRTGAALRKWEIDNLNEDFRLTWEEKAELHALDSEQSLYNLMLMQPAQGKVIDQQKLMNRMAELNKQKRLISIEYKKIRDKNRIMRHEEKKAILGP